MAESDVNLNLLKNINLEQLIKIIRLQSEQIESQKCQINALIKCQQTLLDGIHNNSPFSWLPAPQRDISTNISPFYSRQDLSDNSKAINNNKDYPPLSEERQHIYHDSKRKESVNSSDITVKKEAVHKLQNDLVNLIGSSNCNEIELNEDEEDLNLSSLQEFATKFKARRIELGFTQRDVGVCLGLMQGNDFSQTTLSRFEALNLSYRNMRKLQPLLQRWLEAIVRDGRDVVMARVSAFYQQQKLLTEDESENTDVSIISGPSKKRLVHEIHQDIPDILLVEHHRATADSTTAHIKSSHSPSFHGNTVSNSSNPIIFRHDYSSSLFHSLVPSSSSINFSASISNPNTSSSQHSLTLENSNNNNKRRKRSRLSEEFVLKLD